MGTVEVADPGPWETLIIMVIAQALVIILL